MTFDSNSVKIPRDIYFLCKNIDTLKFKHSIALLDYWALWLSMMAGRQAEFLNSRQLRPAGMMGALHGKAARCAEIDAIGE